jgi:hypothetical protein
LETKHVPPDHWIREGQDASAELRAAKVFSLRDGGFKRLIVIRECREVKMKSLATYERVPRIARSKTAITVDVIRRGC